MALKADNLNSSAHLSPEVIGEEQVSSFYANDCYENKEQVKKISRADKVAFRPTFEETVHIENKLILNDEYLSYSMADGLPLSKQTGGRSTDKHTDYTFKLGRECDNQSQSWCIQQPDKAKPGHGSTSQNPLAGRWSEHKPAVQRETVICSGDRTAYAAKCMKESSDRIDGEDFVYPDRFDSERHQGFARQLDQIFNSSKEGTENPVKSLRYKQTLARGIDQNRSESNDESYGSRKVEFASEQSHGQEDDKSYHDVKPIVDKGGLRSYKSLSPMHIGTAERPMVESKFHKQTIEDIIRGQGKERQSGNMHIQIEERRVTVNVSPSENDYKCYGRSDLSRSPVPPASLLQNNILRMPSPQMSCFPPFLQAQNQTESSIRLKGKPEPVFSSQPYPFGLDPRFYDANAYSHSTVGKPHQYQESLTVDVSPSGQSRPNTIIHGSDSHGYQRPQQQLLQIPRPMALGPNFVPHTVHVQGATPSSEEGNNSSPAGSSPFADYGAISPKSDDSLRNAIRGKHKPKVEGINQCSQCMKTFSSSSALAKHKLIHSDERKYVCQICSKGFKRQDHLNGHMITHRDKKPYECHLSDCDKSYCDMRSLRRHLENHHAVCTVACTTNTTSQTVSTYSSGAPATVTARTVYPGPVDSNGHKDRLRVPSEDIGISSHINTMRLHEDRNIVSNKISSCNDIYSKRTPSPRDPKMENSSLLGVESTRSQDTVHASKRVQEDTDSNIKEEDKQTAPHIDRYEKPERIYREDQDKHGLAYSRTGMSHPWSVSQPYFVPAPNMFLSQQGPWNTSSHNATPNFKNLGQNSMPFLLGLRQQRFHSPMGFSGEQTGHTVAESVSSKTQENGEARHPLSHGNLHPSTLPMFNHMLPGQQNGMQSEMYMRPGVIPYFPGHHSIGRPTNPTAIAVAAAKDNSLYPMFQGRDGFYGAHPAVAQWQPVMQDDSITYEREPVRDVFSVRKKEDKSPETIAVVPTISEDLVEAQDNNEEKERETKPSEPVETPKQSPSPVSEARSSTKLTTLSVNVCKTGSPNSAAVSPGRKQRPHPGPIIIPSAVNNKVSHTVTFSKPSSGRPTSPLRAGNMHGLANTPPFYTPPPMLSPRSIFFTGACTTPRSGQMPSTPSRLLLTARRFSSTTEHKEEDGEQLFPEPKINVGAQFQAVVPENVAPIEEAERDVHKATLMWLPLKEEKYKSRELDSFFAMASSLSLYGGSDNKEYASHLLHKTRGNIKDAVRLLLSRRHVLRADDINADYHYTGATRWSAKERLAFRQAFRSKGKDFFQIQKEVPTKNVKQCVEFYYLWKAVHPEGFRARTRYVEQESEQEEEEAQTPGVFIPSLTTIKEAVFECNYPECRARFVSRQALNGHIRVHGGSLTKPLDARKQRVKPTDLFSSTENTDVTPKKPKSLEQRQPAPVTAFKPDGSALQFACKVCGRVFSKVKSRSAHMKTHVKKPDDKHKSVPLVAQA